MALNPVDVNLDSKIPKEFLLDAHKKFLLKVSEKVDPTRDCIKMSGIYWTLTALDLMNSIEVLDESKEAIIALIKSCSLDDGGISAAELHDSHLLSTLSAIQVALLYDCTEILNIDKIVKYIVSLQNPDGSFSGDKWGEIDTRFSFCALAALKLLKKLNPESSDAILGLNLEKAGDYLVSCQNIDGGFGTRPGSESHAGQAYCVLGALSILNQLNRIDARKAAYWLCERQLRSGGLNGRPQKKPDVCYSWWVVSSLTILGSLCWIDELDLTHFILTSQDDELGGVADRPGDIPDPYHTLFGIAGLSLLAQSNLRGLEEFSWRASKSHEKYQKELEGVLLNARKTIKPINPVFCLPEHVIDRLGISTQIL